VLLRPRALSSRLFRAPLGAASAAGSLKRVCFELPWVLLWPRTLSRVSVSSSLECCFRRGLSQARLFRAPLGAASAACSLKRVCFELPWVLLRPGALSSASVSSSLGAPLAADSLKGVVSSSLGCCFGRGLSQARLFRAPSGCCFGRGLSQARLFRAPLDAPLAAGSHKRVCFELPWVLLRPRALSSASVSSSPGCCFGRVLSQARLFRAFWCCFGRGLSQARLFRAALGAALAAGSLKRSVSSSFRCCFGRGLSQARLFRASFGAASLATARALSLPQRSRASQSRRPPTPRTTAPPRTLGKAQLCPLPRTCTRNAEARSRGGLPRGSSRRAAPSPRARKPVGPRARRGAHCRAETQGATSSLHAAAPGEGYAGDSAPARVAVARVTFAKDDSRIALMLTYLFLGRTSLTQADASTPSPLDRGERGR
jgi:hypothetical protein